MKIKILKRELSRIPNKLSSGRSIGQEINYIQRIIVRIIRKYNFEIMGTPVPRKTNFNTITKIPEIQFQKFVREIAKTTRGSFLRKGGHYRVGYRENGLLLAISSVEESETEWLSKIIRSNRTL